MNSLPRPAALFYRLLTLQVDEQVEAVVGAGEGLPVVGDAAVVVVDVFEQVVRVAVAAHGREDGPLGAAEALAVELALKEEEVG